MTARHPHPIAAALALALGWTMSAAAQPGPAAGHGFGDYKHVRWPIENGAPSRINALGQARDGYLWLGGVDGLFRFDGVTFEQVRPDRRGDRLVVAEILGARSGDVWVGLARSGGVAVYRHGRLLDARMPNPSREVVGLAEDGTGAIWVARGGRTENVLARYRRGRWEEIGAGWQVPAERPWQIMAARDGTLWVVLTTTVVRLPPGGRRFEPTGVAIDRRASIAEDGQGRVWVSDSSGMRPLQPGRPAAARAALVRHAGQVGGTRILFDRHGQLWGTTLTDGIFRLAVTGARAQRFTSADGLTADQARSLFMDREGDVWIGTELGLDMLRPASVAVAPLIPANSAQGYHIAAAADGGVYVTDSDTLYLIAPGRAPRPVLRLPSVPGALCPARGGGVWLTDRDRLYRVEGARVRSVAKPVGATYYGCAEDARGRVWLPAVDQGLWWREEGRWKRWPGLTAGSGVPGDAAPGPDGRAAVLFRTDPRLHAPAPFLAVFKERLRVGNLEAVLPTSRALLVAGARGLARFGPRPGRILAARDYPWLSSVNGLVQTAAGDTWTIGDAGIARMRTAAFDAAFDRPAAKLPHRLFDFRDGLNSFPLKTAGPQVAVGGDGRVWFLTRRNVLVVDPARLTRNPLAPAVLVRSLVAGRRRYRDPVAVALPAGTTSLVIDYTATSLPVPSRVRFRYRLEGRDAGWADPGARRQAVYNDLGPGTFRFQVIAANDDGVWNRRGAALVVRIPPTPVQTWPFRLACALAAALVLWGVYRLRLRQVAAHIRERMEERAAERERIARELHDTLLQGVQGLIMRFQAVADHLSPADPAKRSIDVALDRADQLLVEGRDRVRDLRSQDLRRLDIILADLAREQPFAPETTVSVASDGIARALDPAILDEIVRIAGEALFNAARHADARQVKVQIGFGARRLSMTVQDDGVGVSAEQLARAGRAGHYGMIGMHERARKLGASLHVQTGAGEGTTVVLTLPASLAYRPEAQPRERRRWRDRLRARLSGR